MRYFRFALLVLLAACGTSSPSSGIPASCNPLGGQGCLLPWPSALYEVADPGSQTGFRLALPADGMPVNIDGIAVDPAKLNRWDGFSPTGPILAAFPTGVSATNLPSFKDPSMSLAADSPIVLLDMDTGERAPFFAEVDANVSDPAKADLIIRPLARLHAGARYAVAIRNTVVAADGSPLPVPDAFAALRDGKSFSHPKFQALQKREKDVFAALATAGVDKSQLVVAWDFTVASDEFLQTDLRTMTQAALPAIGTAGANLTFTATEQPPGNGIYKAYLGTFKSPNFLTDGEHDDSVIARDASGTPMMSGLRDATFTAMIPSCVTDGSQPLPRPTLVFGHGLFGSAKDELTDGFLQQLAEQYCFVVVNGNWIGLTSAQVPLAPLAVNDMNRAPQLTEKLGQSIIDFIALENAVRGPMASSPEFSYNGTPVIDPAHTYYVGGSLGGIMGNVFMAYDPNITRGVLAVPGGVWSLLVERSYAWLALKGAAQGAYPDLADYQLNVAFLGMDFEPYDPITTAAHVLHDPLPGVPAKHILMWYSMGDCLVTNLSTEMVARTMGITLLGPAAKMPYGLPPTDGPLDNGINVFDDHPTPLPPDTNTPPTQDNGTHSGINRKPAALRFAQAFLLQDTIVQQCTVNSQPAPCDCATGACD